MPLRSWHGRVYACTPGSTTSCSIDHSRPSDYQSCTVAPSSRCDHAYTLRESTSVVVVRLFADLCDALSGRYYVYGRTPCSATSSSSGSGVCRTGRIVSSSPHARVYTLYAAVSCRCFWFTYEFNPRHGRAMHATEPMAAPAHAERFFAV